VVKGRTLLLQAQLLFSAVLALQEGLLPAQVYRRALRAAKESTRLRQQVHAQVAEQALTKPTLVKEIVRAAFWALSW